MVSDRIPTRIKRFGESVLKQAVLSVQKALPCVAMERPAEDLSAGPGGPAAMWNVLLIYNCNILTCTL